MSFFKYFIGIIITTSLLFFGFSLIAEDKIDQRNFADKMIHYFFSNVSVPFTLRNYLSSFTVPKFEFNEETKFI